MLLTIASFIFVLGVCIFIHELGHFLIAKKVGIRVERFSLGFPPNIFARRFGDTTYCIGAIPLGGYVKMAGEMPDGESTGAPWEFMSKTVGQRAAVIFAGPFMNYVLAIVLLIGLSYFQGEPQFDQDQILIGEVTEDFPAWGAGMREGAQIIGVNGEAVSNFDSLRVRINAVVEEPVVLTWMSDNVVYTDTVITSAQPIQQEDGSFDTVGVVGIAPKIIGYRSRGFVESVSEGIKRTHGIIYLTVKFAGQVISSEVSPKMIGGPLFIAQQSGRVAQRGISYLLFFVAMLSINLAVLNILPIPVLDGGHLLFLLIEKIKGSPVSLRIRSIVQQVGLVVLLSLIMFVTYNDIVRVVGEL